MRPAAIARCDTPWCRPWCFGSPPRRVFAGSLSTSSLTLSVSAWAKADCDPVPRSGRRCWRCSVGLPAYLGSTPFNSSFKPYRMAGTWLQQRDHPDDGRVLDLTDWSLYFANYPGFGIARVEEAAARPETRFVVVRDAHLNGHGRSSEIARGLVAGREPIGALSRRGRPAPASGRDLRSRHTAARDAPARGATPGSAARK